MRYRLVAGLGMAVEAAMLLALVVTGQHHWGSSYVGYRSLMAVTALQVLNVRWIATSAVTEGVVTVGPAIAGPIAAAERSVAPARAGSRPAALPA